MTLVGPKNAVESTKINQHKDDDDNDDDDGNNNDDDDDGNNDDNNSNNDNDDDDDGEYEVYDGVDDKKGKAVIISVGERT